jgi:hypothetical protein
MFLTAREAFLREKPFFSSAAQVLVLFVLAASATLLHGQALTIKILNGRSGHSMASGHVNVWVGNQRKEAMAIPTDKNGIARLRLTDHDSEVNISNRCKNCGTFGVVNPVVKYDDSLRINAGYVLYQPQTPDYSWLDIREISTKQLMREGIVMPNTCGKATASP